MELPGYCFDVQPTGVEGVTAERARYGLDTPAKRFVGLSGGLVGVLTAQSLW